MGMIEVISGVERRRRWSVEEKLSILAEAERPGATVSGAARRHDLHPNQLFRWRHLARLGQLCPPSSPGVAGARRTSHERGHPVAPGVAGFAPVTVVGNGVGHGGADSGRAAGLVEVVLSNGRVVRAVEAIDPGRLARLVAALEGR